MPAWPSAVKSRSYDIDGWQQAARDISSHPEEAAEMGCHRQQLAERHYNNEISAREVAEVLLSVVYTK